MRRRMWEQARLALFLCTTVWGEGVYFGSRVSITVPPGDIGGAASPVIADFNNDGKPDVAVVSRGIAILLGRGDGTFTPAQAARNQPVRSLSAADLDRDGNIDLVGLDFLTGYPLTLRGDGRGGFSGWALRDSAGSPLTGSRSSFALADFNADGSIDLAFASGRDIRLKLNAGDGTFGQEIASSAALEISQMVAADFTGDRNADIVIVPAGLQRPVLLTGTGHGTFRSTLVFPDTTADTVTAGDFNGDGKQDLAFGARPGHAAIFWGYGNGSFSPADWYETGGAGQLAAADINGDRVTDLAGTIPSSGTVFLLKGKGGGPFEQARALDHMPGATGLALGDFDGNGTSDAALTSSAAGLRIYSSRSGPEFRVVQEFGGTAETTAMATGDFNSDGHIDVAVGSRDWMGNLSGVWITKGSGNGSFSQAVQLPTKVAGRLIVGDFNGDDSPDLAALQPNAIVVLLNDSTGRFDTVRDVRLRSACDATGHFVGKFNRDAATDLAVICSSGDARRIQILFGREDGALEASAAIISAGVATASDFDQDGVSDIAVASPTGVRLYYSNGDGTFQPPRDIAGSGDCESVVSLDANLDFLPDIAAGCGGTISLYLNQDRNGFRRIPVERTEWVRRSGPAHLATADLNADGEVDLIAADPFVLGRGYTGTQKVTFHLASGGGSYRQAGQLGPGTSVLGMASADFNEDGRTDLLLLEWPGRLAVLLNVGPENPLPVLSPVFPAGDTALPQSNNAVECPPDPASGEGIRAEFRWSGEIPPDAQAYIRMRRNGQARSQLQVLAGARSSAVLSHCSFLSDDDVDGWDWTVQLYDASGQRGPESAPASFRFLPCRHADGRPCGTRPRVWVPADLPRMLQPRADHTATLLRNGQVLIAGGTTEYLGMSTSTSTAEVYDPATRSFRGTGPMREARARHSATLLSDGRVFIAGGAIMSSRPGSPVALLRSAEIYDPDTGTFAPAGELLGMRYGHTATLLPTGKVLFTGRVAEVFSHRPNPSAEIYDLSSGTSAAVPWMHQPPGPQTATVLRDGRVFIAGRDYETFDPAANVFHPGQPMPSQERFAAVLLRDGRVWLGGSAIFDPVKDGFDGAGKPRVRTDFHTASAISGDRVLVLGGFLDYSESPALAFSEIFDPVSGTYTEGSPLRVARARHTATTLGDGSVIVVGGVSARGTDAVWLDNAEVVMPPQQLRIVKGRAHTRPAPFTPTRRRRAAP